MVKVLFGVWDELKLSLVVVMVLCECYLLYDE